MDTSVSLVVDLEDISDREEGEIIEGSDEENGLENVSSSEDEIVICDHSQAQAKRRKIDLNFKHHINTAQVPQKSRKHESLSDISDLEPEPAFCKKYNSVPGRVQDSFSNFTYRTKKIYDQEKLKSIQRTVRRKAYTRPNRTSENHSSRVVPQRKSRRRRSRSKARERHNGDISSSDTESHDIIIKRRKLKEALSIDSTNKTTLKNRLMSMLGKDKEKSDVIEASKAPGGATAVDEISSEDDIDLLRLRLLALKSKNLENNANENEDSSTKNANALAPVEDDVQSNVNELPNDKNTKDNSSTKSEEGESEEVLQLRIQALRSAMIRKHLARKHKIKDRAKTANIFTGLASAGKTIVDSCEPLSTEKDLLDNVTDVPYSPTQSISDIVSEEMSDLVDNISVSDSQIDKADELVHVSSEALENIENVKNAEIRVENSEIPHMDSGQGTQTCQMIELPQGPCATSPENSKTDLNTQNFDVKLKKTPRKKSFTKLANKKNLISITQQNVINVNKNVAEESSTGSTSKTKSLDSPMEDDEGILREMLLANLNKKQVSENTDTASLDDEDEDILRAMLLSKLSNKMAETQVNAVKNKENTLMIKNDSKTYRTSRSKIVKGQIQKKSQSRSPIKLVKKTVTNTKVINKRITKPVLKPKDNESNAKPKIPHIVVPKLIINLGADSDTDEENPFKCKTPEKIEIQESKMKSTETAEKVVLPDQIQDSTIMSQPNNINTDFEKSLDVFLKTARSKVECTVSEKPVTKKAITAPEQIVTPKIARHMTLAQRKEYNQLLQKIKVMEKRAAKKPPNCVKSPILATTNSNKKSTTLVVKSKEKFANDVKIEIKSDLQDETRKVIAIDKNLNASTELKNVCMNDNCINVTIANDLAVQSSSNKGDLRSISPVVTIDKENNLKQLKAINITEVQKPTPSVQGEKCTDLSIEEKIKELQKNEKFLIRKRMDFIADVDELLKILTIIDIEMVKQTTMEEEVFELRERLKHAESKLKIQNKLTGKLFVNVTQSKKRLELRKRQCIDINYNCMRMGSQISSSYRSPMDGSELMKEKVQQLTLKTAKLYKDIPSAKGDEQIKFNEKLAPPIANLRTTTFAEKVRKKLESKNKMIEDKIMEERNTEVVKIEKVIRNESEFIPLSSAEGFNKIPVIISEGDHIEFKIADYESPLANMENQSALDPNAVLCPYELLGRCEDSQCKFKHLSVASDLKLL